MRNKKNTLLPTELLTSNRYDPHIDVERASDGNYGHAEADIMIITLVIKAVLEKKNIVRVVSDDEDIFCNLGMPYLTGSNTASYLYGKGKLMSIRPS